MKTLATAIALTVALSTPVFASSDDDHEHNSDMKGTEMHGDMMMGHEYMMEMNEHMQEMQKLMARIKQEDDPKKRHKLMNHHMESMQQWMHMMNSNMKEKHGMKNQMDMSSMQMKDRVGMMEQQMDLMQTMMDHLNTPLCGQKWVKTKRGIQN